MSSSKDKDPASIHPGLQSLDFINAKLGSLYFRFKEGEGLRYMSAEAFLAWKALPSSQAAHNRPFCIFLHDYGSSSRIYDKVVSQIKSHCLAADLRGWGRSDETNDVAPRAYSISRMRNDIPRLVDLLQGEKFILVGHGMGAKVAQLYATQQPPKNFVGMVLLAPMPLGPWRLSKDMLGEYKVAYKKRENLVRFTKTILAHAPIDQAELSRLVDDGMKETPLAKDAWLSYGIGEDLSHGLGRVRVPAVVRAGVHDKLISVDNVKREVSNKFKACLHLLAHECGHLIPVEDDELADILELFGKEAEKLGTDIIE